MISRVIRTIIALLALAVALFAYAWNIYEFAIADWSVMNRGGELGALSHWWEFGFRLTIIIGGPLFGVVVFFVFADDSLVARIIARIVGRIITWLKDSSHRARIARGKKIDLRDTKYAQPDFYGFHVNPQEYQQKFKQDVKFFVSAINLARHNKGLPPLVEMGYDEDKTLYAVRDEEYKPGERPW